VDQLFHEQARQHAGAPARQHGPHLTFRTGTNIWLRATRFSPKALLTNSPCMSSLRLKAMNGMR
jgi:hypothetical protein